MVHYYMALGSTGEFICFPHAVWHRARRDMAAIFVDARKAGFCIPFVFISLKMPSDIQATAT